VTWPSRVQWAGYCLCEFSDFVQGENNDLLYDKSADKKQSDLGERK